MWSKANVSVAIFVCSLAILLACSHEARDLRSEPLSVSKQEVSYEWVPFLDSLKSFSCNGSKNDQLVLYYISDAPQAAGKNKFFHWKNGLELDNGEFDKIIFESETFIVLVSLYSKVVILTYIDLRKDFRYEEAKTPISLDINCEFFYDYQYTVEESSIIFDFLIGSDCIDSIRTSTHVISKNAPLLGF